MSWEILVVDDEQGYRDMFTYILESAGIKITCVENGEEAVKKVKEKAFDLILTDVHMPKLTGPEAVKIIKKIRPEQKIIVFSSSSDPEHQLEKKSEEYGIIDCLYKPVELADLERVLKQALGPTLQLT